MAGRVSRPRKHTHPVTVLVALQINPAVCAVAECAGSLALVHAPPDVHLRIAPIAVGHYLAGVTVRTSDQADRVRPQWIAICRPEHEVAVATDDQPVVAAR